MLREDYEAYQIKFEPEERKLIPKLYDSIRNIIQKEELPVRAVRDLRHNSIWLYHWTEEDELAGVEV